MAEKKPTRADDQAAGDSQEAPTAGTPQQRHDPHKLVELLETYLLGSGPTLSPAQVAEQSGIPLDVARQRWRSLGFTAVPDDDLAFTQADVEALEATQELMERGLIEPDSEAALVRTMGRSFARLAEWQLDLLGRAIDLDEMSGEEVAQAMAELVPMIEQLQSYVWRRHVLAVASRQLLAPTTSAQETAQVVGFADIVNYTRQSRTLGQEELERLVDQFEANALAIITEHRGRIIKTIGDEVLFVTEDPTDGARIGLELAEGHLRDEEFPELRVGMAYGPVLARLGDVYGPVVNLASRLTSTTRPGRILIDRDMANALGETDEFRLRRIRRTSVKGYRHLEPWSLRRPIGQDPEFDSTNLPGPASQFLAERSRDLVRAVEERQARAERSSDAEGLE